MNTEGPERKALSAEDSGNENKHQIPACVHFDDVAHYRCNDVVVVRFGRCDFKPCISGHKQLLAKHAIRVCLEKSSRLERDIFCDLVQGSQPHDKSLQDYSLPRCLLHSFSTRRPSLGYVLKTSNSRLCTDTNQRRGEALKVNISAGEGLQDVLKSNLGPLGTIKMFVSLTADLKFVTDCPQAC